jgi:peptide/nickel transport system permease protein
VTVLAPRQALRRRSFASGQGTLLIGLGIIASWLLLALFAPLVAPYDPNAVDILHLLQAPSPAHPFGTDQAGRDVLSRTIHAARVDLFMCVMGVVPPLLIGVAIGLVSGYLGGIADAVLMRIYDVTVAFPFFVLVLAIVGVLGPGLENFFIALALVGWVTYARLVRAEVLVIKTSEYALAARSLGFGPLTIMLRHVLPNALSPVIVYAMTDAVLVILAGASLGFLGMGAQPPLAEWGVMIADGQVYVVRAWWICFFPGLAAITLGIGLALTGDGLARLLR